MQRLENYAKWKKETIWKLHTDANNQYQTINANQVTDEDFDKAWLLLTDLSMRRFSWIPNDFFERAFAAKKQRGDRP